MLGMISRTLRAKNLNGLFGHWSIICQLAFPFTTEALTGPDRRVWRKTDRLSAYSYPPG